MSRIGTLAKSEEDVLTYAMFPDIGRKFLEERAAGTLTPEVLLPIPEAGAVASAGGDALAGGAVLAGASLVSATTGVGDGSTAGGAASGWLSIRRV